MDLNFIKLKSLILISFLCLQARAEGSRSVVFLDGPAHGYIRDNSLQPVGEATSMSIDDLAATISVLLGFAPPSSLSADSSLKLNEVLFPNPFDRPRAVFMLEVHGIEIPLLSTDHSQVGSTFRSTVLGQSKGHIQLLGEDEVSISILDEQLGAGCDAACNDKELQDLAHMLGGSYAGSLESQDGELKVPLSPGTSQVLNIAKKAEREFATSLASLVRGIRNTLHIDESFDGNSPSKLYIGQFTGIEALKKQYGQGDIVNIGVEIFQATLGKLYDLLQVSYRGKIVGVVVSNGEPSSDSEPILDVKTSTRALRSLLDSDPATAIAEIILVRRTLAWITGIILLVSTLIGTCLLCYMPITRDTLLYSNVKLD